MSTKAKIKRKRSKSRGERKPHVINKTTKEQNAERRKKLRVILWKPLKKGFAILRGNYSQADKKFGIVARNKQGVANAIIAPIYASFKKAKSWTAADMDNILQDGENLYKRTILLNKLKMGSTFTANCVYPIFYVGFNKVTIFIGNDVVTGEINPNNQELENVFNKNLSDLVKESTGVIMRLGEVYFSVWGGEKSYFCFCPHDGNAKGHIIGVNCGTSFTLRMLELAALKDYVLEIYSGPYSLYSMKILKHTKVERTLSKVLLKKPEKEEEDEKPKAEQPPPVQETQKEEKKPGKKKGKDKGKPQKQKKGAAVVKQVLVEELKQPANPEPVLSLDYKEITPEKGILCGKSFIKEPESILHTIIAGAIIHTFYRSYMWTKDTISDILRLGKAIFEASDEVIDSEDWTQRIQYPIEHKNKKFRIVLEKIIYGEVTISRGMKVCDFKQGVTDFFNRYDVALVRGPQMVLLWQECGLFFMFDPKERDGMGRKWTRLLSSGLGDVKNSGSACVTWYKNIADLAETYISTVNTKHRKDSYRLVKILVLEDEPKEEDFNEWLAIDMNRWKIVGKTTICTKSKESDKERPNKALCIGVVASIMNKFKPVDEWEVATVDEIMKTGLDIYKESTEEEVKTVKKTADKTADKTTDKTADKKPQFVKKNIKNFGLKDVKRDIFILENNIKLVIDEGISTGKLIGTVTDENDVGLAKGLESFFVACSSGVLTVRDRHLAIWYNERFYYMYYPYEKIYGRNDTCICKPEDAEMYGYAHAVRFKDLLSLTKHLLYILNVEDNMDFSIACVFGTLGAKKGERPPLYNYSELTEKSAMLRPFEENYHEGHVTFGARGDKQTLSNVVVSIGLAQINKATYWNKEDLVDILKIGDRIYCKHTSKLKECGFKDFTYDWKDIELIIGSNKYRVAKIDVTGIFKHWKSEEEEQQVEEEEEGEEEEEKFDDLEKILNQWDLEDTAYGVIDCAFYKVAIWKQENLYFVFDPKASDEQGYPSMRRIQIGIDEIEKKYKGEEEEEEERKDEKMQEEEEEDAEPKNYDDIPNDGAAYVAWFTDMESFMEHLLFKVPDQYYQENFTLSKVTLTNTLLTSEAAILNRFNFHQMPDGGPLIMRATTAQTDVNFPNRGTQEASNTIVALVFALISIPEKWNSTILDIILKYGDRLHSKSLIWVKENDPKTACFTDILSVQHIVPSFSIYKIKFNQKFTSKVFGGLSLDFREMKKALLKLGTIEANAGAAIKIKGRLNTLWKSGAAYYLFDPSPTDPNGYVNSTGFASLVKASGINPLFDYLSKKFGCLPGTNVFEVYFVEVTHTLPSGLPTSGVKTAKTEEQKPDQTMFVPFEKEGSRILIGKLSTHKIPVILLCLATLIHSQLHFVEKWTDNVFEQILFLADYLLGKSKCELDKINDVIKVDLEQLIPNLTIDNVLVHVNIQNVFQGPLSPNPEVQNIPLKNALTVYYRECGNAIITINNKSYALWRENGIYYFFEDQSVEKKGHLIASLNWEDLYDRMVKGFDFKDTSIWYDIKNVKITTIPIKEACQPKKVSEFEDAMMTEDSLCIKTTPSELIAYREECDYWDYITKQAKLSDLRKPKKNKAFKKVSSLMDVLSGNTPHEKHKLYHDKIKYQASIRAAIIVAAGMLCIKDPEDWTGKTIDRIIRSGLILYMNTVAAHGKQCVEMTNFERIFYMMKTRLCVIAHPSTKVFLLRENLFENFLKDLSKEFRLVYFEAKKEEPEKVVIYLLLIFDECYFYIFCPCRAGDCTKDVAETACLLRFKSMADIIKHIVGIMAGFEEVVALGPITACIK